EIFSATAKPDCRDATARGMDAQLSVGKWRLYEGLWSLPATADRSLYPRYALRTDLLCAQARFHATACDKTTRGQISQNLSSPSRKNIPLNPQPKSAPKPRPAHGR